MGVVEALKKYENSTMLAPDSSDGFEFITVGHDALVSYRKRSPSNHESAEAIPPFAIYYNFLHGIELGLKASLLHVKARKLKELPSADDWDELLLPEIERQQAAGKQVTFRGDAAFAKPEIYESSEKRGVQYAIRIPANKSLELEIEDILFRPPGRPSRKPLVRYKSFRYQAESWSQARRIVAPGRTSPGRAVPAGRIHRDEPARAKPLGGALLQQARDGRAVDQGRQTGHALDAAVVPSLPGQRSATATQRAGL